MNKALKWFIGVWAGFALLVNIVAVAGMFMTDGFWGGIGRVQETYSPFNIGNFIMEIVLFSPALLASWWLQRRQQRASAINKG